MIEKLFDTVFSEYGAFVAFLLATNFIQWQRNVLLGNKLLDIVENNTKVITQLVEKLEK